MQENHEKIFAIIDNTYHRYKFSIDHVTHKNTRFGKIADEQKFFWIRIPKCANTFVDTHTAEMREVIYEKDYFQLVSDEYTGCAILRDPMQRWISGAISAFLVYNQDREFDKNDKACFTHLFLKYKDYFSILIEYAIEQFSQEYHGIPQAWRLYPCNPNNIDFFYLNDKLGHQLNHYFRDRGIATSMNNQKINTMPSHMLVANLIQEFIFDYANQKYKEKITEILKPDYELISLINFYNK